MKKIKNFSKDFTPSILGLLCFLILWNQYSNIVLNFKSQGRELYDLIPPLFTASAIILGFTFITSLLSVTFFKNYLRKVTDSETFIVLNVYMQACLLLSFLFSFWSFILLIYGFSYVRVDASKFMFVSWLSSFIYIKALHLRIYYLHIMFIETEIEQLHKDSK